MGYTLPQISGILLKADRTMYKIGKVAYDDMFNSLDEALEYDRDIIYIYKAAVEYGDDFYVGQATLDAIVERLWAKINIYDYGQLNPIYSDATIVNYVLQRGSVLNDLDDVTIKNLQDNQILKYSAALGQWVNTGSNAAIRSTQAFTATLNQTVFTTTSPFTAPLLDVYLNGVRLNSASYSTFGNYTITLYDGCLADDIIDVTIYDPQTDILDMAGYVKNTRTLTINGVTYDLSADRTWTIATGDMTKAVYDTDNDGIVDDAEKVTIIARNSTGSTIHKGKIVYLQGSTGNRPNMLLAQANVEATSSGTFGVVIADVNNNSDGQVAALGTLHDLDTRSNATNPFTADTLVDGDTLWLSPTTAGYVTKTKPTAPNHAVFIGIVARTTPSFGRIVYRIQNGYELYELHDVSTPSYIDKGVLYRDVATNLWKTDTIANVLGYTPISTNIYNSDGTLTADRTITSNGKLLKIVGGKDLGFSNERSLLIESSNTSRATVSLALSNTATNGKIWELRSNNNSGFEIYNATSTAQRFVLTDVSLSTPQIISGNNNYYNLGYDGGLLFSGLWFGSTSAASVNLTGNSTYTQLNANGDIYFTKGLYTNHGRIFGATGNWLIQTGGTYLDAGYKLDVNGTARVSTSLDVASLQLSPAASVAMYIPNGHSIRINNADGTLYIDPSNPVGAGTLVIRAASTSIQGSLGVGLTVSAQDFNSGIGSNGYALNGKRILLLKSDETVLRFNDNTSVNQVGMRGSQYIFDGTNDIINWSFNNSAAVDIRSTTRGFLPPRMTTTQRDAIATPATGLQIYNTTTNENNTYNGTAWVAAGGSNIYTADGTLTGDRTVTSSGNSLTILGGKEAVANQQIGLVLQGSTTTKENVGFAINNTFTGSAYYNFWVYKNGNFYIRNNTDGKNAFLIQKDGNVQIGATSLTGTLGNNSTLNIGGGIATTAGIKIFGNISPATGNGLELYFSSNSSYILSLDRDTSTWRGLELQAGDTKFRNGGTYSGQIFSATGNWLIQTGGTFTDSGYKLDVNGTARVSGATTINAATTGTSGYSLSISDTNSSNGANILLQYGGNGTIFRAAALGARIISTGGLNFLGLVNSNGNVNIGADENTTSPNKLNIHVNSSSVDGQGISLIDTGGSGNVGAGINYFGGSTTLMASIRTRIQSGYLNSVLAFSTNNASNVLTERFRITETGNVLVGSTTNVPSAILAADSTTKGFLPPRMTSTQKSAISTPATGLVIYQTDSTEGLYQYKSTGWEAISGGGTPAGSNTQIQYNNAGAFGASAGLTYNDSTGVMTLSKNQNAATTLSIINTTNGSASQAQILLQCSGSTDNLVLAKFSPTSTPFSYFTAGDSYLYSYEANLNIATDSSTKQIRFGNIKNTASPAMTLTAAGRLLLGTTTESTYLLDVNGTARVSDTMTINSSSSNGVLVLNQTSIGYASLFVNRVNTTNAVGQIAFSDLKTGANNRSFGLGIGRSGDPQWTNGDFIFAYYNGSGGWQQSAKIFNASGNWAVENGTATSDITSALLQVNSTTKGFLPPRMTATQLAAISSPAVGLVAYQTDGTEGLYQYKSTGWALVAGTGGGSGTVTSVDMSVPTGFAISGNPVTTSGTLALAFASGYSLPTTTKQSNWDDAYTWVVNNGAYSVTSVTTTHTVTAASGTKIIKADTTGGAFTVTLPTAVGNTATIIIKKSAGTAALTVDGAGTETIDGGLTATINKVYESITLISDNTNWQIV